MRIVINGVSIDCKNRSRIQIFDGLRHVSASMEVRTLAYILERDMKRRAARKPGILGQGDVPQVGEDVAAAFSGQALDHVRVDEPEIAEQVASASESLAGVDKCGQHDTGNCKMDDSACDGKCGEHASRAAKPVEPPMSARGDEFPPVEPVEPIPFVNLPAALCAPVPLSETVCPECDLRPGGSIKVKTLEAPVCMACGRKIYLAGQWPAPGHE